MPFKKAIVFFICSICFLSYGLTDKQIDHVKQQISLLQQNKYKDYLRSKKDLKATNIGSYLEYKEIALNLGKISQERINNYLKNHESEYWAGELCDDLAIYYVETNNWEAFRKFYDGDLDNAGRCWVEQKHGDEKFRQKAIVDFSKYWDSKKI